MEDNLEIQRREKAFQIVIGLWDEIEETIGANIKEISEKMKNKEAKKYLDYSYEDLKRVVEDLREYSLEPENRNDFHDFIIDTHQKVFKNLMKSIKIELRLNIGDSGLDKFFMNFLDYLSYCNMRKKYPGEFEKICCGMIDDNSIFEYRPKDKQIAFSRMIEYLIQKNENIPHGYTTVLQLLNQIRNIAVHTPNCIKGDFLFKHVEDYGNFYIACNFIIVLIYAYLEILDRWNRYLY